MDRYGWGPQDLGSAGLSHRPPEPQDLEVRQGMVIEEVQSGWVGAAVSLQSVGGQRVVGLEDRHGAVRSFPLGDGFLYEGEPVRLVVPRPKKTTTPGRTRSGSVAV